MELQSRQQNRVHFNDQVKNDEDNNKKVVDSELGTAKKDKEQNKSVRKMVKKAKTEMVEDTPKANKLDMDEPTEKTEKDKTKDEAKKKAKLYNIRDGNDESESDAASDSEPSEDNLEEDQIMKLVPKKIGKKRFIKGIDD